MKVSIVYWSGTGNTEAMANAVAEGAKNTGAEVELLPVSAASADVIGSDALLFGCPAMGSEELEESEFEPFFSSVEGSLSGKKMGLFGSYDAKAKTFSHHAYGFSKSNVSSHRSVSFSLHEFINADADSLFFHYSWSER